MFAPQMGTGGGHRNWSRALRRAVIPAGGAFLALAIAACGSSGADEASTQSTQNGGESAPPARYTLAGGGKALIGPGGQHIAIQPKAITGFVDSVIPEGGVINLTGWAAAPALAGPAQRAVAMVDGKSIGEATPSAKRPDVVEAYGAKAIEGSGFALFVETSSLRCGAPAGGVTVFGIAGETATALPLVGASEKELDSAC